MQNSLSGGVGWSASGMGASASSAHSMKLSFQGPTVLGFDLIDFVPTDACVAKLTAFGERGGDLTSLVVVQEAMMARVSGCEQRTVSADVVMPGGGGYLAGTGACQMFSDAPVAVGVKTVALSDIPELADLVGAASTAPPPAAAARPTTAPSSDNGSIEWVQIPGGAFEMGSNSEEMTKPVHTVRVSSFELMKTELTVGQYRLCVDAGACTAPASFDPDTFHLAPCNWGRSDREDHPVNCVRWTQAQEFAHWAKGRLPSEAEWEYAARNGGSSSMLPWGDEAPNCSRAVLWEDEDSPPGCGLGGTSSVCSRPAGNSVHGVCDLLGNVAEYTQDNYHDSYVGAPADGSAREDESLYGIAIRGGSYLRTLPDAHTRGGVHTTDRNYTDGFRLVR